MTDTAISGSDLARRNRRTMVIAACVAAGSLSMGFAAVPLYRLFCQVTGFGGTTMRADPNIKTQGIGKSISIRFDSNVSRALPWGFTPEEKTHSIVIGEKNMAIYLAKNLSDKPVTGQASFNVTPEQAGAYFSKIQCFCFTEQMLQPGQEVRMPVIYFVDPKILDDPDTRDIEQITLSYTFYPVEPSGKQR